MQNVWRLSNRNMFHHKVKYLYYLHRHLGSNTKNFQQCLNQKRINIFRCVSQNRLKNIQVDCKAVNSMLVRSLFEKINTCTLDHCRYFSIQSKKLNEKNQNVSNNSSFNDPNKKKSTNEKKEENIFRLKLIAMCTILSTAVGFIMSYIYSSELRKYELSNTLQMDYPQEISWTEFVYQLLSKGEVKEIVIMPDINQVKIEVHSGATLRGHKIRTKYFIMNSPEAIKLEERIRETERNLGIKPGSGVSVVYYRPAVSDYFLLLLLLSMVMIWIIKKQMPDMSKISSKFFGHMSQAKFTLVDPLTGKGKGVKFTDVAGLREAKIEIMEFVDYLKRPEHYKILGAKLPKGTLLLGPPGCGKTLLAKAVATEANVPFLSMNGSEFTEIIGGLGAARIRHLFNEAKKRAPSIIYIDEIDTIGRKRLDGNNSRSTDESEQTLNQLLTEMDGMETKQDVIVLASTNRGMVLDKALLRRGRFDRHILIDYPDIQEREEIFELHLKKLNLDHKPSEHSKKLASMTSGNTGADIANMCNEAALRAARLKKSKVQLEDLLWAIERILIGAEKINSNILEHEKRILAFHEAGHALVNWLLESLDDLYKVSIVQRTNNKLRTSKFKERVERKINSQQQIEDWICFSLAGRVAENLAMNVDSTSAQDDLEDVTKTAYMLVRQMGMNKSVGLIAFTDDQVSGSTKFHSKSLGNLIDQEVRLLVNRMHERTKKLLMTNYEKLKLLAEALMKKESLTYEEVKEIIGPRQFKQKTDIFLNVNKKQE